MVVQTSQPATCQVCGLGPPIDAHLFPRALGHDLKGKEKHLYVGGVETPGRRIVQAGLFDRNILCATHDGVLGAYDNYGIEFCRTFKSQCKHPAPNIWQISNVDPEKLVRFWLSILWRFSISNLPEAALVQLGPYENKIQEILFSQSFCAIEPAITMLRYRSRAIPAENICFTPYHSEFPGLNAGMRRKAYGIAVSGFHAFIKVDAQPLPYPLRQVTINGKDVIHGGYLEFENTHQFKRMLMITNNMNRKPT
jgi:hypothetical protein